MPVPTLLGDTVEPAEKEDLIKIMSYKLALINEQLRRDLSRSVFAEKYAIRIDKPRKRRYNNAVINSAVIEEREVET